MDTENYEQSGEGTSLDISSGKPSMNALKAFVLSAFFFTVVFVILYSPTIFTGHLLCTEVPSIDAFFGPNGWWTNSIYSGFPWIAEPACMNFYPPAVMLRVSHENWNFFVIMAYVLSGAFMFSFTRLITGSSFAGLIGAIAFTMSYLTNEIVHYPMVHSACWMVGVLLALELCARKSSGLAFAGGALAVSLCGLAGHPQTFASALGLWIFYTIARSFTLGKEARLRFFATGMAMIVLGGLVAGLQLFHTAELSTFSAREKFTFDDFLTYAMHPLQVVGVFLPFLYGGAPDGIIHQPLFGNFLGYSSDVYYGFVVMFLSLSTFVALRKNSMVLFWGILGLLCFLVAFGNATPLAWLMYHVPPYGGFRALHRMMLISTLANAVLAAIGVRAIEERKMPFKPLAIVVASLTGLFIGLVCEIPIFGDLLIIQSKRFGVENLGLLPWTNPSIGVPCLLITLAIAACIIFQRSPKLTTKGLLLFALLCDLGFASWYSFGAEWRTHAPLKSILLEPASGRKYQPLAEQHHNRILTIRGGSASYDELKTNLDQCWDVPQAAGYGPLMLVRYGKLLNMTEGGFLIPPFHYKPEDRCFDILSIKYATAAVGDNRMEDITGADGPNWRKIEDIGTASIHENLHVLPRCWLVNDVQQLTADKILESIKTSRLDDAVKFDPLKTALVEEPIAEALDRSATPAKGSANIVTLTNSGTRIETNSNQKAFLVVSDIFYPGWHATIDGNATTIYRTDYVLRGVEIPAGKHVIDFRFEPTKNALAITVAIIASLLILLIAFILDKKKNKISE